MFLYRVRQAEQLRERGDLVTKLTRRWHLPWLSDHRAAWPYRHWRACMQPVASPVKPLELYKPLVKREPENAQLWIGAADMAAQVHERDYAEDALEAAPDAVPSVTRMYSAQRPHRLLPKARTWVRLPSY